LILAVRSITSVKTMASVKMNSNNKIKYMGNANYCDIRLYHKIMVWQKSIQTNVLEYANLFLLPQVPFCAKMNTIYFMRRHQWLSGLLVMFLLVTYAPIGNEGIYVSLV